MHPTVVRRRFGNPSEISPGSSGRSQLPRTSTGAGPHPRAGLAAPPPQAGPRRVLRWPLHTTTWTTDESLRLSAFTLIFLPLAGAVLGWLWQRKSSSCPLLRWAALATFGYPTKYKADDLKGLRIAQLKVIAAENSVPTTDCFTKEDLLDRLLRIPDGAYDPRNTPRGPTAS
eukprot:EG_transcript_33889